VMIMPPDSAGTVASDDAGSVFAVVCAAGTDGAEVCGHPVSDSHAVNNMHSETTLNALVVTI
jgi:hypothetical protein